MYDVIIIGGSYAGLSAGLQLARARRSILVIDAGIRRNRFADKSHGFLTQDGRDPADIVADARAQLMGYQTVDWLCANVESAENTVDGFRVSTKKIQDPSEPKAQSYMARRLILATGVTDILPDIPGVAERWGSSIFHCPYCHGYEINQGRIGIIASSDLAFHLAPLLSDWGPTTLFLNGWNEPDAAQLALLNQRKVSMEYGLIDYLAGEQVDVVLKDGRTIPLDGLFIKTETHLASPVANQLGCEMLAGPQGFYLRTDDMKSTTVPGVFACGDAARPAGSIALAVADGVMAGIGAHASLTFGINK